MRVLLLDKDARQAASRQRRLAERHEVRTAESLAEALLDLAQPLKRPDLIVTDLDLPDGQGYSMLRALQEVAFGVPILVCDRGTVELPVDVDVMHAVCIEEWGPSGPLRGAMLYEHQRIAQAVAVRQTEALIELEKIARTTADKAAARAVDTLARRLGLEDAEGVRMAVRLARGWEAVKNRFLAAIATGLAGALLVALGAGVLSVVRSQGAR